MKTSCQHFVKQTCLQVCYSLLGFTCTRVKTHKLLQVCIQVVTRVFTSCVCTACSVFVGTGLKQVVNKVGGIIRLATRLFQQVCNSHDIKKIVTTLTTQGCRQWRSQPDIWSCKCKFFCVYRPYKESISKEMNNEVLNLHSMTKLSGWLRYWLQQYCYIIIVTALLE